MKLRLEKRETAGVRVGSGAVVATDHGTRQILEQTLQIASAMYDAKDDDLSFVEAIENQMRETVDGSPSDM